MSIIEENKVIQGILEQDDVVIKKFYEDHFDVLLSWIRKRGGQMEDAQDIFQDAIIALYLNLKMNKYKYFEKSGISGYFMQICKFRYFDRLKKKANQELSWEDSNIELIDEEFTFEIVEKHYILHKLVDSLGEKCRTILKYFYWENKDMKSIANLLNMEPDSVKNAKYRCLNSLRSKFQNIKK